MENKQCTWFTLLPEVMTGAEDPPNGDSSNDSSNDSGDAGSASSDQSGQTHDDADDPNVKGLKSSLEKERRARAAAEKALAKAAKEREDRELAEKSEVEQAKARETKAQERVTRLAAGLLTRDLNDAIKAAAKDFIDPADAIAGVDIKSIEYTQDDDDPTDIVIDAKSVERAVKALAARKPHWLKTGTEDGDKTGSQFGGSRRNQQPNGDEELRAAYPSLRN